MASIENRIEIFFESINRKSFWFLVILVAANVILKFFQLSNASIWLDEAHTANQALKSISEIISDSAKDQNPPLYFIMMHFWVKIVGISEFGLRSFPALLNVITLIILFLFARENFNVKTAFIASLLFTFSEQQIYFSEEARVFALIGFLCTLSFFIFFRLIKNPSFINSFFLGVINVLLLYSHFISCFIIVVQVLYMVLLFLNGDRKVLIYELLSIAVTTLIFIPWIKNLIRNIPKQGEYWLTKPAFYNLKGLFISFSNGKIMTILFVILVCIYFLLSMKRYYVNKRKIDDKHFKLIFLLLWFLFPVIADYFLSEITPVFLNKYLLYTSIGLYLLVGFSLSNLPVSNMKKSMIILITLILFIVNTKIKVEKSEDWRSTVVYVRENLSSGDVIILSSAYIDMPFSYYYDRNIFRELNKRTDLLNAEKIFPVNELNDETLTSFNPSQRIVLVQSHLFISGSGIPALKTIEKRYHASKKKAFGDIEVFIFDKFQANN